VATIETFRRLGALDRFGLLVPSILLGGGGRLNSALNPTAGLEVESTHAWPEGAVDLVYRFRSPPRTTSRNLLLTAAGRNRRDRRH
jgi:hypothetical protein